MGDIVSRIFIGVEPETGGVFDLPEAEARHLKKVLRARPGDDIEAVTPSGKVCVAQLGSDGTATVTEFMESEEPEEPGTSRRVVLYQAVPKGKRMEVVVEKAVEVGVDGIVPILTERSVAKPGEGTKLDRWRRIAESAARQSLRRGVPEVSEPVSFDEAVASVGFGVMLDNSPEVPFIEEVVGGAESDVALFVGPEGGFSEGELAMAAEAGILPAQMGPFRMRSETAGLVAVIRARAVIELSRAGVLRNRLGMTEKAEG